MNDKLHVALTDYNFPSLDIEMDILGKENIELHPRICQSEEELIEHTKHADGIIDQFSPITRRAIDQLERCKVIAVYGIGTNQIDLVAASERGIPVVNVPDYCIDEVAAHAVSLILDRARQVANYSRLVENNDWAYMKLKLHRFSGSTVGIVGLGAIGRSVAKKLQGFDVKLIGYDPFVSAEAMSALGVAKREIEEVFRESDYITLHLPLLKETRGLISTELFNSMKPTAFFVNVSRGGLVDEEALLKALDESRFAGAALDVLVDEPPAADHPLVHHPAVLVTPHIAWYSDEAYKELREKVAQSVADVLRGRTPKSIANKHLLKK